MSNRLTRSACPGASARQFCAVGAVLVALAAIWSPPAVTVATPNVCHITGITRAVAKKVFPKLSGVSASQGSAASSARPRSVLLPGQGRPERRQPSVQARCVHGPDQSDRDRRNERRLSD
jgi:hypothetical protein